MGMPAAYLPIIDFIVNHFSRYVAGFLIMNGYEFDNKNDEQFIDSN